MTEVKTALLHIDIQNDFCPGGALPVAGGDQVTDVANRMTAFARENNWKIMLSRDWHPANTKHFEKWPIHCVQNTVGARFHPNLDTTAIPIFSKGMDLIGDDYSGFSAVNQSEKGVKEFLDGVSRIYVD